MEVTFPCTGGMDGGVNLGVAELGSQYSMTFHGNGTVDLLLSGISSQNTWVERILEVDSSGRITNSEGVQNPDNKSDVELFAEGKRKAFVIDYSGLELIAVWTESGFEMNYFDTMMLYFER